MKEQLVSEEERDGGSKGLAGSLPLGGKYLARRRRIEKSDRIRPDRRLGSFANVLRKLKRVVSEEDSKVPSEARTSLVNHTAKSGRIEQEPKNNLVSSLPRGEVDGGQGCKMESKAIGSLVLNRSSGEYYWGGS